MALFQQQIPTVHSLFDLIQAITIGNYYSPNPLFLILLFNIMIMHLLTAWANGLLLFIQPFVNGQINK